MIEINLVPDVKQELLRAERVRTSVISLAVLIGAGAIGVVVLLAIWVFGVQFTHGLLVDNTIKEKNAEIAKVDDLSNTLTIQNQLQALPTQHSAKSMDSRLFSLLTTINPPAPNEVNVTSLALDAVTKTITIEAQARNAYPALEAFRKTITATNVEFSADGEKKSAPLTTQLSDTDRSYGEDADGNRVLRFTLSFVYADQLFSPTAHNLVIVAPTKSNVTDSFLGIPKSLFTTKAADTEGGDE